MNQPWIYMCSPSWSPLPPPSSSHPSGSSQCTSSEHLSHASSLGWWSASPLIIYMFDAVLSEHPTLALFAFFRPLQLVFTKWPSSGPWNVWRYLLSISVELLLLFIPATFPCLINLYNFMWKMESDLRQEKSNIIYLLPGFNTVPDAEWILRKLAGRQGETKKGRKKG